MSAYEFLPASYDRLTNDVAYDEIWSYIKKLFLRFGVKPQAVVDLACGTGTLSWLMQKEGLAVTGVDMSEEMLTVASSKFPESGNRPRFVRAKMQRFSLPEPVDAVISCLDSVNYLTKPEDFRKTICRVYDALCSGGVFVFDMNTPLKFRQLDGQVFLDEDDDVYCVWRAEFCENTHIMTYGMDIFRRTVKVWRRYQEEHQEYAYEPAEVMKWLADAGFGKICCFGDRTTVQPEEEEQRIYIACMKE